MDQPEFTPASYFPNTELLGDAETRITTLDTGMPIQTRKAVSISYPVELGNGDKFLFDMGLGSMADLFSLRPDFSKLDIVFAGHLHIDHEGNFMELHIGGWQSVTLRNPRLAGGALIYDIDVLEEKNGIPSGPASLFIDPIGNPFSPTSRAGVHRRHRRRPRRCVRHVVN